MFDLTDTQKIGVGLTAFGATFLFLGILLFFDGGLLAMGNILFISGVVCIIGVYNAFRFFFGSADKMKGTSFFLSGVMCVLLFSPMLGMLVELVGLYYLFSGFLPVIIGFLRRIPVVNTIFYIPFINKLADSINASKLPV